jgi:glutamate racemase
MPLSEHSIGIFDSGLGGLTVLKAVRKMLPSENLVYFGDTAHVPYGSKSAQTVTSYSLEIAGFLCEKKIKLLIVACNTASALALETLHRKVPVPVIGVIEPGAKRAVAASAGGRIGVIGTEGTVRSGAYKKSIKAINGDARVMELACPLFVPLVEEGWWRHRVTRLVASEYLDTFRPEYIDTLILGCTHYPVIKDVIASIIGPRVNLIDSAEAVAAEAKELLAAQNTQKKTGRGKMHIYASDDPARFKRLAANILGSKLDEVELKRFC